MDFVQLRLLGVMLAVACSKTQPSEPAKRQTEAKATVAPARPNSKPAAYVVRIRCENYGAWNEHVADLATKTDIVRGVMEATANEPIAMTRPLREDEVRILEPAVEKALAAAASSPVDQTFTGGDCSLVIESDGKRVLALNAADYDKVYGDVLMAMPR